MAGPVLVSLITSCAGPPIATVWLAEVVTVAVSGIGLEQPAIYAIDAADDDIRFAILMEDLALRPGARVGHVLDPTGPDEVDSLLDTLAQLQIDDVLFARHLVRHGRCRRRAQREAAEQQKRKAFDAAGSHDRRSAPSHLFWILSPLGPTLICRPSGCFLVW